MKELFSVVTPLGKVSINVDPEAQRQVPYLYMHDIFTPAKGKKPAAIFTMTVSDYKNIAGSVAVIPEEAVSKLVGFSAPLINAAAKSDSAVIRESFSLIDCIVKDYEDTKESASGPVERKVDESITSLLARVLLVAAGKTGEIPGSVDASRYFAAAYAEACNMAETLGQDALGQFRLKKAKAAGTTENTSEVPDSE